MQHPLARVYNDKSPLEKLGCQCGGVVNGWGIEPSRALQLQLRNMHAAKLFEIAANEAACKAWHGQN